MKFSKYIFLTNGLILLLIITLIAVNITNYKFLKFYCLKSNLSILKHLSYLISIKFHIMLYISNHVKIQKSNNFYSSGINKIFAEAFFIATPLFPSKSYQFSKAKLYLIVMAKYFTLDI